MLLRDSDFVEAGDGEPIIELLLVAVVFELFILSTCFDFSVQFPFSQTVHVSVQLSPTQTVLHDLF